MKSTILGFVFFQFVVTCVGYLNKVRYDDPYRRQIFAFVTVAAVW